MEKRKKTLVAAFWMMTPSALSTTFVSLSKEEIAASKKQRPQDQYGKRSVQRLDRKMGQKLCYFPHQFI